MSSNLPDLVDSTLFDKILQTLLEEQKYAGQISTELESSAASISNYLKQAREQSLVERGKRTKAQYYKITEKGRNFLKEKNTMKMKQERLEMSFRKKYDLN